MSDAGLTFDVRNLLSTTQNQKKHFTIVPKKNETGNPFHERKKIVLFVWIDPWR